MTHIIQQEIDKAVGVSSRHDRSLVVWRCEDRLSKTNRKVPFGHIRYVFVCASLHEVVADTADDVVVCTRQLVDDRLEHADAFGHGIGQPAFHGLCIVTSVGGPAGGRTTLTQCLYDLPESFTREKSTRYFSKPRLDERTDIMDILFV